MSLYSVEDLIGKTLYAAKDVPLYRTTGNYYQGDKPVYIVKRGQAIGVLDTWIQKGADIWFLYYDSNKRLYVSQYKDGFYSGKQLKDQGVKTEEEKTEEARQGGLKWYEKLFEKGENVAIAAVFIWGMVTIMKSSK